MRKLKWFSPALQAHAEKAREYLTTHKTVTPKKMSKVLGVGQATTYSAIQLLNHHALVVWTVEPGANGKGGGWELATETVREL
jgi:hypothetical protein